MCCIKLKYFTCSLTLLIVLSVISEANNTKKESWQQEAVERARILSRVKWTPVAEGMSIRSKKDFFKKGIEYTGVPYSSISFQNGRFIGFDIFLKTFLAAVQNPRSILYTKNLQYCGKNGGPFYGAVCSSFTSYALGCSVWRSADHQTPGTSKGVYQLSASAQIVAPGDIIFTREPGGDHIELITGITRDRQRKVTHVRVEDSYPKTTRDINYTAGKFNSYINIKSKKKKRRLLRIYDIHAWRGKGIPPLRFPDYKEDSLTPVINRVLLLDRGDWVAYKKREPVKINIMDKDSQGVKKLVLKRDNVVVEEVPLPDGKGLIERLFSTCGNYTAHCAMADGSQSQACEFSICEFDFYMPDKNIAPNKPLEVRFTSDNIKIVFIGLQTDCKSHYKDRYVFLSDADRKGGKVVIPGKLMSYLLKGAIGLRVSLVGENKYGRLKKRQYISLKENM